MVRTAHQTKPARIPGLLSLKQVEDAKWRMRWTKKFWAQYTGYHVQYDLQTEQCLYIIQQGKDEHEICISIYPTDSDAHAQITFEEERPIVCMDHEINLQSLLKKMWPYWLALPFEKTRSVLSDIYWCLERAQYQLIVYKSHRDIYEEPFQPYQED